MSATSALSRRARARVEAQEMTDRRPPPRAWPRSRRGQNLVLFALTLLLLTLMVLVTLQVGMRAKERVEAQLVADAAAYSEAVTTARTYNMVAVMNRARVAHFVALLGVESLVSWSGLIRGSGSSVAAALDSCGATAAATALRASALAASPAWERADDDAGAQARGHQGQGTAIRSATQAYYRDELIGRQISAQSLADRIARLANPELRAPAPGAAKSMEEIALNCTTGAACMKDESHAFMSAVMGSRGWVFTTDRAAAGASAGGGLAPIVNTAGGGSGFGDDPWFGSVLPGVPAERAQVMDGINGEGAWAEDHGGAVTIQVGGCTAPATVSSAFVMSSALEVTDDQHYYAGIDVGTAAWRSSGGSGSVEPVRHTLGSCPLSTPGCPGVVGGLLAYNRDQIGNLGNDHGQPKLYAMIERDYRRRAFNDPWALFFNFQFRRGGPSDFDNGRTTGTFRSPGGADLSQQVAVGAGIAYYHRPTVAGGGGFDEPPNFWNPFWRATLGPTDADVGARLGRAGYPEAQAAYDQLRRNGWRGAP
ncbi:MAG: hypothetical protein IPJ65_20200 [Archangiaceae bacterium]|nr:hypothetical protein [Archangiaceae bacterium]